MSKLGVIFAFVAGAGLGSLATWHYANKKFNGKIEEMVEKEIESVKEVYGYHSTTNVKDIEEAREAAEKAKEKPSINEYASKVAKLDYTAYSEKKEEKKEPENDSQDDYDGVPYVISPDEFGEIPEYAQISLSYFADGLVADDDYRILEDVEDVIGFDSLNHIGEFEDDSVHVRNDRLKCDYEILVDHRKYADVIKTRPYLAEE